MGRKIITLLAVLVVLSGCSKKAPNTSIGPADDSDLMAMDRAPISDPLTGVDGSVLPGSEQDLVVNIGDRVFFGYDQYDLTPEARMTIEKQTQWLKTYPSVSLLIEGHSDERGTREYNLALGEKRANAVRNYMIALGADSSRVQTISYGKERPAVLGSDAESWAQNRRGVAVVQ